MYRVFIYTRDRQCVLMCGCISGTVRRGGIIKAHPAPLHLTCARYTHSDWTATLPVTSINKGPVYSQGVKWGFFREPLVVG